MTLREKLKNEIVIIDGAMGTYLYQLGLKEEDFGDKPGCMENLLYTRPDLITRVHEDYCKAGACCIETNSFGGNAVKLGEYGLGNKVLEVNRKAAEIARDAADKYSFQNDKKYVIGSIGPTGKLPSTSDPELGNISYEHLKTVFYDQTVGLIEGGVDAILIETGQDLLEIKAAVNGAKGAIKEAGRDIVVMAQFTIADSNRMLLGSEASAVVALLSHLDIDVIGINCGAGPLEMEKVVKFLSDKCPTYVSCIPNAGLPMEVDGKTVYPMKPVEMAEIMGRFTREYDLNIIGGCCGTSPAHIKEIAGKVKKIPAKKQAKPVFFGSFYKGYELEKLERPVKVGERINTLGSRKTKEMLLNKDYDGIVELGKEQQSQGSDLLDVCGVLTERHTEKEDMVVLVKKLSESVNIPLMIDSTDVKVIKESLDNYPGTAFINSVNLEDGGRKADEVFTLAKEHGAFVVCLVIDEKGMAKTCGRKVEIARKIYDIGVNGHGLRPHQLIFDMLTFSLSTGSDEFIGSAVETYKAIKTIKEELRGVSTVLGVSNVSFGLPKQGRKILNAVYLHHAVKAGLDLAIVNPAHYLKYEDIPAKEAKVSEELIFEESVIALNKFTELFIDKKPEAVSDGPEKKMSTIEDRLKKCIVNRNSSLILDLLDESLKDHGAKEIINNVLLEAMRYVGEKFDSGELVLPYVLQSAEVMRKAVTYLEDYLPHEDVSHRGKILLATVFGDVHDIGKNLVKMILSNNGYDVIDMGKQVPVEKIIECAKKEEVDAVGLSALLVSTARHMKTCVQSMHDAGLEYPVIIGGAPVNERYAEEISVLNDKCVYKGGVFYAKDAFTGLNIMQSLLDRQTGKSGNKKNTRDAGQARGSSVKDQGTIPDNRSPITEAPAKITSNGDVPSPPFWGSKTIKDIRPDDVFKHLDLERLFAVWGKSKDRTGGINYEKEFQDLKKEVIKEDLLDLKSVYGYFPCIKENDDILVLGKENNVLETFSFNRTNGRSLADYVVNAKDIVAFQAVTVGEKLSETVRGLQEGQYSKSYFLHILSVQLAEALAEYMHARIRYELNLRSGQGKRYSPGYPLWEDLHDQKKLFALLDVEKNIGVILTEEDQMVPEQSTTAMVLHSDAARY